MRIWEDLEEPDHEQRWLHEMENGVAVWGSRDCPNPDMTLRVIRVEDYLKSILAGDRYRLVTDTEPTQQVLGFLASSIDEDFTVETVARYYYRGVRVPEFILISVDQGYRDAFKAGIDATFAAWNEIPEPASRCEMWGEKR